jgi:hypothetical protein
MGPTVLELLQEQKSTSAVAKKRSNQGATLEISSSEQWSVPAVLACSSVKSRGRQREAVTSALYTYRWSWASRFRQFNPAVGLGLRCGFFPELLLFALPCRQLIARCSNRSRATGKECSSQPSGRAKGIEWCRKVRLATLVPAVRKLDVLAE